MHQPRDLRSNSQPHPFYRVSPPHHPPFPSTSSPQHAAAAAAAPPLLPTPLHPSTPPPTTPLTPPSPPPPPPTSTPPPPPPSTTPWTLNPPHTLSPSAAPPPPPTAPPLNPSPASPSPPSVPYSDAYTFPPPSSTTPSAPTSNTPSLLPSSHSSPTSGPHDPPPLPFSPSSHPPLPPSLYYPSPTPSPTLSADRLDSLRPDALHLPRSTTSPQSKIPHSISLPTLPPTHHSSSSTSSTSSSWPPPPFALPTPADTDVRALDSSVAILHFLLHQLDAGDLSHPLLRRHLHHLLDALTSLKSSTFFRSTSIHAQLFHTLALRRSTSETMADQEVVDWISHEYLTPRRGSTSSDGGGAIPLSHSVSHASALQAHHQHSHSMMHQPHVPDEGGGVLGGGSMVGGGVVRRHPPLRSNSLSAVTLRSGSHPSLESLPPMAEAKPLSPLVRATNLIRIIRRMASSRTLTKDGSIAEEEVKEREGEEKSGSHSLAPTDADQGAINATRKAQAARRKSHLDLPTSTSPLVQSSAANISAPFLPNAPSPKLARSPSSKALLQSAASSSPSSRHSVRSASARQASSSSPQATPSPRSTRQPQLFSPSSSSPSPHHSSPSSANKSMSRSHSSSSSTPSSDHSHGGPLYYALVDRVLSDPLQAMLGHVDEWTFDIFAFHALAGPRTLSCLMCYLFDELSIFDKFSVRREVFAAFIGTIEDGYAASVPYHNAVHAADVLLNTYFMLQTHAFASSVTSLDVFASLVAAAVHDYGHPGTNNAFQIATQSDVALRYNDVCVLESMHCSEAFFVLKRPDHNVLEGLSPAARTEIRSTIIHQVLATDMQQHFTNLAQLKAEVDKKRHRRQMFDLNSSADRLILLSNLTHSADLGNPCKPLTIYLQWTERLIEEFHRQGDRERELGLPISLMMDRNKPNVERSQVGFIDVICEPLWATMAEITPQLQPCLEHLTANRDYWLKRLPPATPKPHGKGQPQQQSGGSLTSSGSRSLLLTNPSFVVPAMS